MVFRYPGGKSRLVKDIIKYFDFSNKDQYYEPFVGGGSVAISIAKNNKNLKLYINDLDDKIYSFWKLFELDSDELFKELFILLKEKPTVELFKSLRERIPLTIVEKAYYAIFFNRTTFSGIYKSGPIGGYEQESKYKIDCRYNSNRLINNISELRLLFRSRIFVYNEHFEIFFKRIPIDGLTYIDPPYYWEGKGLYMKYMSPIEHERLGSILKDRTNWVLSYDKCKEIRKIYKNFCMMVNLNCKYSVDVIKKEKREKSKELIILPKERHMPNCTETANTTNTAPTTQPPVKRKPGRPKGSKNKPKTTAVSTTPSTSEGLTYEAVTKG